MLPYTFLGITPPVELIAAQQFREGKRLITDFLRFLLDPSIFNLRCQDPVNFVLRCLKIGDPINEVGEIYKGISVFLQLKNLFITKGFFLVHRVFAVPLS